MFEKWRIKKETSEPNIQTGETRQKRKDRKKRSSQASRENMLPGNSFPQICVVSVNHSVEIQDLTQEYGRIMSKSNHWLLTKLTIRKDMTP